MLNLELKDFIVDNCLLLTPKKKVYFGRFMLYNKWVNSNFKDIENLLNRVKRPYDYFEAQEFMMGLRSELVLSDGYETFKLTR